MSKNQFKKAALDTPTNLPEITEVKKTEKIKNKKGKQIKTVETKTEVIQDNKASVLDFGGRKMKDFLAVDIDRTNYEYLKVGDRFVRSFMINGYPSMVQVGWLNDLYNFDGDLDTALHIFPSDERGALDQLTYKITQFEAQLDIEMKKGNIRNRTKLLDQIDSLVQQRRALEQNWENLYMIEIAANIYETSEQELKKTSQKIINKLKARRIGVDEMYLKQEDSYKTALPIGMAFIKDKLRNFNTGALAACFPFYNSEISHDNGIFIGINMSTATPMFIDFYDRSKLNNSNISVFGQAGSGKTFFVSLLTLRSTIKNIRTVIVDPEGEYNKISRAIGGTNIQIAPGSETCVNPFDIEEEDEDDGTQTIDLKSKVSDILNLVAVMVGGLTNEQKAMVSHVIAETYNNAGIYDRDAQSLYEIGSWFDDSTQQLIQRRKKSMPTLTNLRESLIKYRETEEDESRALSPIINTLKMFCKGGIYDMFDRQTSDNIKDFINAPIVNFDVCQLEESILRPIGMYVAMSWTWEKFIKKNPQQKKRIVCDEAWMLTNKNMNGHEFTAQFLENCARRIRKRNGGLLVASQNFVEFADNPQGKAVLTNTIMNIFLKQNTTDIDAVQDTFKLSDGEKQFLLTAKRGEMLVRLSEESALVFAYPFQYELDVISASKIIKDA